MRELQWHEKHRTLDLLRSARAEGFEIHVPHGLYSGEFVRIVKKAVEAEEGTADGCLLPVEQYCASVVQDDRIARVHVGVIERRRDISRRISIENVWSGGFRGFYPAPGLRPLQRVVRRQTFHG